jgi:hypothetical protein
MKDKTIMARLALVLGVTVLTLAWCFYGWPLSLILFLALWGNNASQHTNK